MDHARRVGSSNHLLWLCGLIFSATLLIHEHSPRPIIQVKKQETAFNLNKEFMKFISFGNKRLISSVMWIQTLLESDDEKYGRNDYENWMYLRFLAISSLDPLFYENYLYGGMYLSVVKDDLLGAADIFELGLRHYPEDYSLNYYHGFNYYFELGDFEKGFRYLSKIEHNPRTPQPIRFVIQKLRFANTGNYEVALEFLKANYRLAQDEGLKKKLSENIYAVVAERDLECLNKNEIGCHRVDATGKPYLKGRDGIWKSQHSFKPYRIYRPGFKEKSNPRSISDQR